MTEPIKLVAMAPSADVFIMRDPYGRTWLSSPYEGELVELATDDDIELAISRGDLHVVDESFERYSDLGEFLEAQAALVPTTGIASEQVTSAYQVELLLNDALLWKSDGTEDSLDVARQIIERLLESEPAQNTPSLRMRLERELAQFSQDDQPAAASPTNHLYAEARRRMHSSPSLATAA